MYVLLCSGLCSVCSEGSDVIGTAIDVIAPSMAVADGTMNCVVACAARWSHIASGDGMVYASVLHRGGLPVMVGWVAS